MKYQILNQLPLIKMEVAKNSKIKEVSGVLIHQSYEVTLKTALRPFAALRV